MILFLSLLALLNSFQPSTAIRDAKIKIENAWVRPDGKGMNSALYFNISNNGMKTDDLYKITSTSAELVQMHETIIKNGLAEMKEVKSVSIPTNMLVEFKPGGYHVMLIGLKKDLKAGEKIIFFFYFKRAGRIRLSATVKQN